MSDAAARLMPADAVVDAGPVPAGWPPRRRTPYVKICGVTTAALADEAVAVGADLIGIVHFRPSPRHLDIPQAADVAAAARGRAMIVALTVDATDLALDALFAAVRPDALQLHGRESLARVREVAARYGVPVARAVGVATRADLDEAAAWPVLPVFDAKPPAGADRPGGHGQVFDWAALTEFPRPYMLSGGLHAGNVGAAVAALHPYAVDVSSGVETGALKDPTKMAAFVAAVRAVPAPVAA